MYKYEFYRIEINPYTLSYKEDYKEVVLKYSMEGWRLVQIFAPSTGAVGTAKYCELVFEQLA